LQATTIDVLMFAVGVFVGAIGTMVGVGGGFLIVPAIALLQPTWSTRVITAFSLAVVSANAWCIPGGAACLRKARVRAALVRAEALTPLGQDSRTAGVDIVLIRRRRTT
jgi:uncharacterized membrane protein YfcA